jgi:predicted RNA-binding Zn-ribbon protein involved in translation (DUF1610 family)
VSTPAACLGGALAMVCYGRRVDAPISLADSGEPGSDGFVAALNVLDGFVLEEMGFDDSFEYNDARGRSAEEVMTTLHMAADRYDEVSHVAIPHMSGELFDCPACAAACYCADVADIGFQCCVRCALEAEAETDGVTYRCPDCGRWMDERSPSASVFPGEPVRVARVFHCPNCDRWQEVEVTDLQEKDLLFSVVMNGDDSGITSGGGA